MKRIVDIDMSTEAKKPATAIRRFFKKYPEHKDGWQETVEWMFESGTEFFSDNTLVDGTHNDDWCYAIHAQQDEDMFYIAIIERA